MEKYVELEVFSLSPYIIALSTIFHTIFSIASAEINKMRKYLHIYDYVNINGLRYLTRLGTCWRRELFVEVFNLLFGSHANVKCYCIHML